jgi:hypothetical protein
LLTALLLGIIYASTKFTDSINDKAVLQHSVDLLFISLNETPGPTKLWNMYYWQASTSMTANNEQNTLSFADPPLDLIFDDSVLDRVRDIWKRVLGVDVLDAEFLVFEERQGEMDDEEDL